MTLKDWLSALRATDAHGTIFGVLLEQMGNEDIVSGPALDQAERQSEMTKLLTVCLAADSSCRLSFQAANFVGADVCYLDTSFCECVM